MLRLEGVAVAYGGFTLQLDLDLPSGKRLAVMGPSGSGKSTLLSLVSGFLLPDAGRLVINGKDVTRLPVADRPLSILFQDGNLFPHLNVFDNVALGISPSLRLSADDTKRVERSLSKVGLAGFGPRMPAALSGGQQSRVALARMLLRDQPLALFDEPFAALDPGLRREMLALIDTLCVETGLTVLMVTHDIRDAEHLCDRLLLLDEGKASLNGDLGELVALGPPQLAPWL